MYENNNGSSANLLAISLLGFILVPGASWAGDGERDLSSFQIYTENDTFLRSGSTDEYYTNGLRFAWIRNSEGKGKSAMGRADFRKMPGVSFLP